MMIPMRPNERWSLDFVADQMTDCRRFRMLAIVEDCTRECLALMADIRSETAERGGFANVPSRTIRKRTAEPSANFLASYGFP